MVPGFHDHGLLLNDLFKLFDGILSLLKTNNSSFLLIYNETMNFPSYSASVSKIGQAMLNTRRVQNC